MAAGAWSLRVCDMKNTMKKIADIIGYVYGTGIALCLFIGGLSFFGYLAALIIGGDTATAICVFIYKKIYPPLVYASSVFVLLGLVKTYFSGEKALSLKNKEKKN